MTHITKERAQELLDVSKHPPCGGAATCVDREGEPACDGWTEGVSRELLALAATVVAQADELARLRAVVHGPSGGMDVETMADLRMSLRAADEIIDDLRAERKALRAIVEGREEAPSAAEAEAHCEVNECWLAMCCDGLRFVEVSAAWWGRVVKVNGHAVSPPLSPSEAADVYGIRRWWALDADGRPTARPTPAALASAGGAAPLDPVDALNAAVTAAIFRAERLAREGADATAAYADVARYEAALAALHPADTVEGETAREGVRLAVIGCAPVGGSEESGWMLGCDVGGMRVGDPPGQWGGVGRPRPEAVTVFGRCVRAVGRARKGAAE